MGSENRLCDTAELDETDMGEYICRCKAHNRDVGKDGIVYIAVDMPNTRVWETIGFERMISLSEHFEVKTGGVLDRIIREELMHLANKSQCANEWETPVITHIGSARMWESGDRAI